jgi:hypothetical protein
MTIITRATAETYKLSKIYDLDNNFLKSTIVVSDKTVFETENESYTISDYFADNDLELDPYEERRKKILCLAMVYNVDFPVTYTMTAPYTHSYCVSQYQSPYIEKAYCEPVTHSKDWYKGLADNLYRYLIKNRPTFSYQDLLERVKVVYKDESLVKKASGATYRGVPTSDAVLKDVKRALVIGEPIENLPNISLVVKDQLVDIQDDFNQIREELLGK